MYFILGHFDKEINFSFGDETDAIYACGITFQNEFWMFGGWNENRQVNKYILNSFLNFIFKISKVVGCSLKRQSSLEFDFYRGTCGTYQLQYKEKILLCFAEYATKSCHW